MIKNWLQFLKESQQLELFKDDVFPFTEEDIQDYLLELEEAKYYINVRFGWLNKDNRFTEKIESYIEEPCIGIDINSGHDTSSEDMTKSVTTFIKRMQRKAKAVRIYDNDGELDIKFLKFEGGIFLNERPEDSTPDEAGNYHDIQLDDGIFILCVFNKRKLTNKEIFEYYGIVGEKLKTNQGVIDCLSYNENENPVFEVEVEDLARWAVSRDDSYVKYITDPESIWEWYSGSFDYTPDHYSFLYYHMSKENIELLLKVCILKDGWEEVRQRFDTQLDQEAFIQEAVKDTRNYDKMGKIIEQLPNSEEIYNDLRKMYVDFEEQAKAQEDLDEIITKFDEIVEEQFKTTIVGKNRYTQKVTKTNKSGQKYEYDSEFQTYKLLFNFEWFENLDADVIKNAGSTYNILLEFTEGIYREDLNPHFSDYASVDDKEFNKSVKSDLEHYLKSTE